MRSESESDVGSIGLPLLHQSKKRGGCCHQPATAARINTNKAMQMLIAHRNALVSDGFQAA